MLRCITAVLLLYALGLHAVGASELDPAALRLLVERARATHTEALVVLHDGKLVGSWNFGHRERPMLMMSIAKSVCALAIGALLDDGKLRLEESMADFVPSWRGDPRGSVTVREVLSMTTGLADPFSRYFALNRDLEQLAVAEPLVRKPGSEWRYNNTSVNLIDTIVRARTGRDVSAFLNQRLFAPLAIHPVWLRDSAGHVPCAAGLSLRPADLAILGDVVANGGTRDGHVYLSPQALAQLTGPSQKLEPRYGLLWWVIYSGGGRIIDRSVYQSWVAAGMRPDILAKIRPMVGQVYPDDEFNDRLRRALAPIRVEELDFELRRTGTAGERFIAGGVPDATWALGDKGQKLYVSPAEHLVVVRLIPPDHWRDSEDDFFDFLHRVRALVPKG